MGFLRRFSRVFLEDFLRGSPRRFLRRFLVGSGRNQRKDIFEIEIQRGQLHSSAT